MKHEVRVLTCVSARVCERVREEEEEEGKG